MSRFGITLIRLGNVSRHSKVVLLSILCRLNSYNNSDIVVLLMLNYVSHVRKFLTCHRRQALDVGIVYLWLVLLSCCLHLTMWPGSLIIRYNSSWLTFLQETVNTVNGTSMIVLHIVQQLLPSLIVQLKNPINIKL